MSTAHLAPAFVATVSVLSGTACNSPQGLPGNPPQPSGWSTSAPSGASANPDAYGPGGTASAPKPSGRVTLNPKDANARTIFRSYQGVGCFVNLPFPPLKPGEQRVPGTAPPTQPSSCPPALHDPAYDSCRGGALQQIGDRCECFLPGNPPHVVPATCPS